ncbi:NADP-dependent oxidoreductase domain-containing protein [Trichoderma evansii]
MVKLTLQSTYKLASGFSMPVLGYGVYQTPPEETAQVTLHAFKAGYSHVDSARGYANESGVGEAIRKSGLKREDVFFTTKLPMWKLKNYDDAMKEIDASLKASGLNYIDLYLTHSPHGGKENRINAWRALVDAQKAGKVRSIGVSNYGVHHLDELQTYIKEQEAQNGLGSAGQIEVAQYELHPWLTRPDIVAWCRQHNVVLQAYCPLVQATRMDEPVLKELSKKYNRTEAQILIRWSLQNGFVPLPKSVTPSRIDANKDVFDFEISDADMTKLTTNDYSPCTWDLTMDP